MQIQPCNQHFTSHAERILLQVNIGQLTDLLCHRRTYKNALQIWDLDTQHCVQTVVGHRSEVWSLDVSPDGTRLVTTASDAQLRVWSIVPKPTDAVVVSSPF